jgi:hypothetical protein
MPFTRQLLTVLEPLDLTIRQLPRVQRGRKLSVGRFVGHWAISYTVE